MKKYIYNYISEFRGSIKGINRYLKSGDLLNPEDVAYFQHHYPDRIVLIESNENISDGSDAKPNESDILKILSEQSEKISELINVVKSSQPIISSDFVKKEFSKNSSEIKIQEPSMVNLLKVDTSEIESQGTVGETKTEGESVLNKVNRLRKVIRDKK